MPKRRTLPEASTLEAAIKRACADFATIRGTLIAALGLKPE